MKLAADDVQSVVIPGCGHYCLGEAPEGGGGYADRVPGPYREKLSSGLDAQVRVPDPPGNAQKGVL